MKAWIKHRSSSPDKQILPLNTTETAQQMNVYSSDSGGGTGQPIVVPSKIRRVPQFGFTDYIASYRGPHLVPPHESRHDPEGWKCALKLCVDNCHIYLGILGFANAEYSDWMSLFLLRNEVVDLLAKQEIQRQETHVCIELL